MPNEICCSLASIVRLYTRPSPSACLLSPQVPGLFNCLCLALEADTVTDQSQAASSYLGDAAPLGWLALNTALHVPGARQNEILGRMADALATRGGAAAKAAAQIRVLLAPAQSTGAAVGDMMDVDGAAAAGASAQAGVVAVEDLWQTAGGRHDNEHQDYWDIQIMVTSQEVGHTAAAH